MFRLVMIRSVPAFSLMFLVCLLISCQGGTDATPEPEPYTLPDAHPDNANPLKVRFFQEPFRDLAGNMVQIENYVGVPMVIVVFPSFKTDDGRRSLIGMEALQRGRERQFFTIFIPVESAETISPSIVRDPENMLFLFRANGLGNLSLADKYSSLFWNEELISADYPLEPASRHYVGPFYWIVDADGTIREKLIDYSNQRGVTAEEVGEVLDALLGPLSEAPPESEFPASSAETEELGNENAGETGE
jgi:hypothetical protein